MLISKTMLFQLECCTIRNNAQPIFVILFILFGSGFYYACCTSFDDSKLEEWAQYSSNPYRIKISELHTDLTRGGGGILVADIDNDGLLDYLLSTTCESENKKETVLSAYSHQGKLLWVLNDIDLLLTNKAEIDGLPGLCAPGIEVADVDLDGSNEVVYLSHHNEIIIRNGLDGQLKRTIDVGQPSSYFFSRSFTLIENIFKTNIKAGRKAWNKKPERWSHFQIVNLIGEGDNEIILQADPVPFNWLRALSLDDGKILWETDQYHGLRHGGFKAFDIDLDGFDEVLGGNWINNDGTVAPDWHYKKSYGHLDALVCGDIVPTTDGLEWIVLEEGAYKPNRTTNKEDRTILMNSKGVMFYASYFGWEPQNAAIGEFDTTHAGLEIWCRSRFDSLQKPWIIGSDGKILANWEMSDVKPDHWSDAGVEFIFTIDWDGSGRSFCAAKERHTDGKICIFDPMTGEFLKWWEEKASRIFVADVSGDPREEIIALNSDENELRVYWNEINPAKVRTNRLWAKNYYKRQKMNYNYYSP